MDPIVILSIHVEYFQQDMIREHFDCHSVSAPNCVTQVSTRCGRFASTQRYTLTLYFPLFLAENPCNTFNSPVFVEVMQSGVRGRITWQGAEIKADWGEALIKQSTIPAM